MGGHELQERYEDAKDVLEKAVREFMSAADELGMEEENKRAELLECIVEGTDGSIIIE